MVIPRTTIKRTIGTKFLPHDHIANVMNAFRDNCG